MNRWHEISNVVNHKRIFNIECTEAQKSVGFTLQDAETGRYFWKLCVLQHTFFLKFEQNHMQSSNEHNINLFQNVPDDLNESRDDLFAESTTNIYASDSHIPNSLLWNQTHAANHRQQTESIISSNMSLSTNQLHARSGHNEQNCIPIANDFSQRNNSNWALVGSNTSLNNGRVQSTSCLDLSNNNGQHERERLKAFLPGYRPAPDYETAVQQKCRASESELRMNTSVLLAQNHVSGSQPDVHRSDMTFSQQLQQKYPDVTQTTNTLYQQHMADSNVIGVDGLSQQLQMMRLNKPCPPPYQANRLSSTSTPDLASHQALLAYRSAYVSGSSPDLVSTRTFLSQHQQPQFMSQQQVYPLPNQSQPFRYRYPQQNAIVQHGTYENLNYIDGHTKTNMLSQKLQQQNGYRPQQQPATVNGLLKPPATANGLLKQTLNGSIEPIYENVPLPWQGETNPAEMRDRTSSVQSAPGVMRFKAPLPLISQHRLSESNNNFTVSNTSLTTINDYKNNNLTEHAMLAKSTSNPIDQYYQKFATQAAHDAIDGGDTTKNGTVISINMNSSFEPNVEIIQPPDEFKLNHKPMHKTRIEISNAADRSASNTSNIHADDSQRSNSISNILDSSQISTFTNQTANTTDSGVSVDGKEKKKRRWLFFGNNNSSKSHSGDKQKCLTLGREKDKNKANKSKEVLRTDQNSMKQRWNSGPKLQPLAATISKEKLVRSRYTIHINPLTNLFSCFLCFFISVTDIRRKTERFQTLRRIRINTKAKRRCHLRLCTV